MTSAWEKFNVKPSDVFYSKESNVSFSFVEKAGELSISFNFKGDNYLLPVDNNVLPKYLVPLAEMRVNEKIEYFENILKKHIII